MSGSIDFDDVAEKQRRVDRFENFKLYDKHYHMILGFYGDRVAERSGIPHINHIDEGLFILAAVGATDETMQAWCLHPIVQPDEDLRNAIDDSFAVDEADVPPLLLAMEYRAVANSYLSPMDLEETEKVKLRHRVNRFEEVRFMLVADKIQNHKDFIRQPEGTYPNEKRLQEYFVDWILNILELNVEAMSYLTEIIIDETKFLPET